MQKRYMKFLKISTLSVITAVAFNTHANAQLEDIGAFLRAGADDATILTKEYLKPFPTGLGTGLNSGWHDGAAPKKTLGFSLVVKASAAFVPTSDRSFDISTLGLQNIEVASGENPVTPTIAGSNSAGPNIIITDDNENELTRFRMPQGTGINFIPAPMLQVSVGLIKNTDISLRFVPEVEIGDYGSFAVTGAAVKHGLNQWLPGGELLPVDLAIMAGFNIVNLNGNLDVTPQQGSTPVNASNPGNFEDQEIETSTNTYVVNAIVGKTLPLISIYGGLGYQGATLDVDVKGDYPVDLPFNRYEVMTDPVSFNMDSKSSLHALGGFRIKLGILAIYGEATFANYITANAGIGFSFR